MAGPIKISFLADVGKAQKAIKDVAQTTEDVGESVEKSGKGMSAGLDKLGDAALGMNSAVDTAGSALQSLDDIQNAGRNEAMRLARAQQDVKQAELDGEQAATDLKQATEDLKQAQIDGKQAAVDIGQAQIDKRQADLDAATAQTEYNTAVKKYGANSAEARQAQIDLAQAQSDGKQAAVDLRQAQADQKQAQIDATQAQTDGKQAIIDAKNATLDLADAQREANPTFVQQALTAFQTYAPVLAAATVSAQTLAAANLRVTVTSVAQRIAMVAGAIATGAMTAAQWALNVAMDANPVGIVILGIAALAAALVVAWKRSETFRNIVTGVFTTIASTIRNVVGWVRSNWPLLLGILTGPIGIAVAVIVKNFDRISSTVRAIPGKIRSVFSGAGSLLVNAGRSVVQGFIRGIESSFKSVQNTLGRLTSMLPDWKGPASRDQKILGESGQLVMAGFLTGLESQYGIVQASLEGFTTGLSTAGSSTSTSAGVSTGTPAWAQRLIDLLDGGLSMTLTSTGNRADDAILAILRDRIRVTAGGSVTRALGS